MVRKLSKYVVIMLVFVMIVSSVSGCQKKTPDEDPVMTTSTIPSDNKETESESPQVSEVSYRSKNRELLSIAVSPEGKMYASTIKDGIICYSLEGDVLEKYPDTEKIAGLCYSNGLIYGFERDTNNIMELNPETKEVRLVSDGYPNGNIKSITVNDGKVLLLYMPFAEEGQESAPPEVAADGYINQQEAIYIIDIESGEMSELGIENAIAFYTGSDEKLYVYTRPAENRYVLCSYDVASGSLAEIAEMNDIGYIYNFAYEQDNFISASSLGIRVKRMSDEVVYISASVIPYSFGGPSYSYYDGHLLFLESRETSRPKVIDGFPYFPTHLRVLSFDAEMIELVRENTEGGRGEVVISAVPYNQVIDTDKMLDISDISGKYVSPASGQEEYQAFLESVLSGDDTTDIYMFNLVDDISQKIQDQSAYVPLSDSEPINTYLNQCFDWVGESAKNAQGEIWMLPVSFDASALWLVPQNFDRFGLTPDRVDTFDKYLQTIQWLNREKGDLTTHATVISALNSDWQFQYEMTHNDYTNGIVNFNTDEYRRFLDGMWTGWRRNDAPELDTSRHPILQQDLGAQALEPAPEGVDASMYSPDYDISRVIFKLESIAYQMEKGSLGIGHWRVLPLPRISQDVKNNYFVCSYAMINPHSKNQELAKEYLETLAQNMLEVVANPVFVQEDTSVYADYYDMNIPVFQDLYNLYLNGAVFRNVCNLGETYLKIDDYQNGDLTLDDLVGEIQGRAEAWMNGG